MRFPLLLALVATLSSTVGALPGPLHLLSRAPVLGAGSLCGVSFRSGGDYQRCGGSQLVFNAGGDKLVPLGTAGAQASASPQCDHKVELSQIFNLISDRVKASGSTIDQFCQSKTRAEINNLRRAVNSNENLVRVPAAINQAKKAFVSGGDSVAYSLNDYRALGDYMDIINKDLDAGRILPTIESGLRALDGGLFPAAELTRWKEGVKVTGQDVRLGAVDRAAEIICSPAGGGKRSLVSRLLARFFAIRRRPCSTAGLGKGKPITTPKPVPASTAASEAAAFCTVQLELCAAAGGAIIVASQIQAGTFIPRGGDDEGDGQGGSPGQGVLSQGSDSASTKESGGSGSSKSSSKGDPTATSKALADPTGSRDSSSEAGSSSYAGPKASSNSASISARPTSSASAVSPSSGSASSSTSSTRSQSPTATSTNGASSSPRPSSRASSTSTMLRSRTSSSTSAVSSSHSSSSARASSSAKSTLSSSQSSATSTGLPRSSSSAPKTSSSTSSMRTTVSRSSSRSSSSSSASVASSSPSISSSSSSGRPLASSSSAPRPSSSSSSSSSTTSSKLVTSTSAKPSSSLSTSTMPTPPPSTTTAPPKPTAVLSTATVPTTFVTTIRGHTEVWRNGPCGGGAEVPINYLRTTTVTGVATVIATVVPSRRCIA